MGCCVMAASLRMSPALALLTGLVFLRLTGLLLPRGLLLLLLFLGRGWVLPLLLLTLHLVLLVVLL